MTMSPDRLRVLNAKNQNYASKLNLAFEGADNVQGLSGVDVAVVLSNGQSLSTAQETFPPLTTSTHAHCKMIGGSDRPTDQKATVFQPCNSPTPGLNPLKATCQETRDDPDVMTEGEIEALDPWETHYLGESTAIACLDILARATESTIGTWIGMTTAVGGTYLNQLLPGRTPAYWNRNVTAIGQAQSVPATGVRAHVLHMLGIGYTDNLEDDDQDPTGAQKGWTTRAQYMALLDDYQDGLKDLKMTGQAHKPLLLLQMPGVAADLASTSADVCLTQLEFSQTYQNVVAAGSDAWVPHQLAHPADAARGFPQPHKAGPHKTTNGARWWACMMAKVAKRVLVDGKRFEPLSPLWVESDGRYIYVGFLVPFGPLQKLPSYYGAGPFCAPDWGITVIDRSSGPGTALTISSIEILNETTLKITLPATPAHDTTFVRIRGVNNIGDSDPAVSPFNYEFVDLSCNDRESNWAQPDDYPQDLVCNGRPYDLRNRCVAGEWVLGHDRLGFLADTAGQ